LQKNLYFLLNKIIQCGDRDGVGIPEPVGDEDEVQLLIPVGYGKVMGNYMRIEYGDGECKISLRPIAMSILVITSLK